MRVPKLLFQKYSGKPKIDPFSKISRNYESLSHYERTKESLAKIDAILKF